jgi:hypothetical protein
LTGSPAPQSARVQRLIEDRKLERITPDPEAVVGVWRKAVNSGVDADLPGVSLDNAVDMAYRATLQAAHALVESHGFRVRSGQGHHYLTFYVAEALGYPELARLTERTDPHRTARSSAVYDPVPATQRQLDDLREIVRALLPVVHGVLRARHPDRAARLAVPGTRPPPSSA